MFRTASRTAFLALALLAAGAVAAAAVLADGAGSQGRTIRLVERGSTSVEIDNPPKGNHAGRISPGDLSAGVAQLVDRSSRPSGRMHLVCVATVGGGDLSARFQCSGSIELAGGTLALSALNNLSSKPNAKHIAVVGGTGSYEGARGHMTSSTSAAGVAQDVIHLQTP
jgi:hypothetical protein